MTIARACVYRCSLPVYSSISSWREKASFRLMDTSKNRQKKKEKITRRWRGKTGDTRHLWVVSRSVISSLSGNTVATVAVILIYYLNDSILDSCSREQRQNIFPRLSFSLTLFVSSLIRFLRLYYSPVGSLNTLAL